ncbi:hypothetical protein VTJ04DRAFT_162 [Mycothermus thermophilus]|uniref:uncharacterized protein n=1 Tax=Humicola insolens TaxID=85995 RepID=UPI0037437981
MEVDTPPPSARGEVAARADPPQQPPQPTQLAQPQAPKPQKNPPTPGEIQDLWNSLLALVPAALQGTGRSIANKIREAYRAIGKAPEGPTLYRTNLPEEGLRRLIAEEVKKAVGEANRQKPPTRSWADVVAGGPPGEPPAPQKPT